MEKEMKWENLFSTARYGSSNTNNSDTLNTNRSSYDRDYGRILFSSAFRRLQDKTQVFPLGRNDYVRTRLTHSLEVAHIGMSLGKEVGNWLITEKCIPDHITASDVGTIVSSACLAHDIGNPPFGHSGENAIEEALKNHGQQQPFEGNAQGFRILTRIGDPMNGKGLKLTAAVLGAFMKYPCSKEYRDKFKKEDRKIEGKKIGIGNEELETAKFVAEKLGLIPRNDHNSESVCWCRHPFAYLMEAADDICYRIADIEDGYFSGLLSFEYTESLYKPFLKDDELERVKDLIEKKEKDSCVHYMRALAIGSSISAVVESFKSNEKSLLRGELNKSLIDYSKLATPLNDLYEGAKKYVYQSKDVIQVEAMGYKVLGELIDFFMKWVKDPSSGISEKIAIILHGKDLESRSENDRLIHMIDYVSGMTDSFALETYRKLIGIS